MFSHDIDIAKPDSFHPQDSVDETAIKPSALVKVAIANALSLCVSYYLISRNGVRFNRTPNRLQIQVLQRKARAVPQYAVAISYGINVDDNIMYE